jgi:hypothetical protein
MPALTRVRRCEDIFVSLEADGMTCTGAHRGHFNTLQTENHHVPALGTALPQVPNETETGRGDPVRALVFGERSSHPSAAQWDVKAPGA